MGWVGCYDLHLYCDDLGHSDWERQADHGEFTDQTRGGAVSEARKKGWSVSLWRGKDHDNTPGRVLCPKHAVKRYRAMAKESR